MKTFRLSLPSRVSFHSDALHVVERYRRVDAKTLEIEATVEDPKVLTKPWIVPRQTLTLAPFDQIMELACSDNDTQTVPAAPEPPIRCAESTKTRRTDPCASGPAPG
jgi:hypothetical protein